MSATSSNTLLPLKNTSLSSVSTTGLVNPNSTIVIPSTPSPERVRIPLPQSQSTNLQRRSTAAENNTTELRKISQPSVGLPSTTLPSTLSSNPSSTLPSTLSSSLTSSKLQPISLTSSNQGIPSTLSSSGLTSGGVKSAGGGTSGAYLDGLSPISRPTNNSDLVSTIPSTSSFSKGHSNIGSEGNAIGGSVDSLGGLGSAISSNIQDVSLIPNSGTTSNQNVSKLNLPSLVNSNQISPLSDSRNIQQLPTSQTTSNNIINTTPPSTSLSTPLSTLTLSSRSDQSERPPSPSRLATVDVATESLPFDNYESIVNKSSIENILTEHGYTPIEKIFTQLETKNGLDDVATYIEVVNTKGQLAYVQLDTDGFVAYQPNDRTLIEVTPSEIVPYQIRSDSYQCVGSAVCGVGFKCINGICTLINDNDDHTPREQDFITTEAHAEKAGILDSNPIAYPIVRLSEIMANPNAVAKNIATASKRIRDSTYEKSKDSLETLYNSIENLRKSVYTFYNKQDKIFKTLLKTTDSLESFHDSYKTKQVLTNKDEINFQSVMYNLRRRNELIIDLLKINTRVSEITDDINSDTQEINKYISLLDSRFNGIEFVLLETP